MIHNLTKNGKLNTLFLVLAIALAFSLILTTISAQPSGPTITVLDNTTKNQTPGQIINSTANGSSPGGYIFTVNLNSLQQNTRWKAYVGNVTGTLTLDDADDQTIFQWSLSSVTGEVYATRASGTVNWSGINCTWAGEGVPHGNESNRTVEELENAAMNHTNVDDNITSTFTLRNHSQIVVGDITIPKDSCFSLQTYQNDSAQVFDDSDDANFTQVILYDGTNISNGNIVYETTIEQDLTGFNQYHTYDFQMIVPESGAVGFSSSTAYYFYVELT